jgi:hyperosmotically inducible periplasmic protein
MAADQPVETFHAYVDSDICARLMLGPITEKRVGCSQKTVKDGASPLLVRLQNNMVLTPNKEKMLKNLEGKLASATGQVKAKDGTVKLQDIKAEEPKDIPAGDPARKLMDIRTYRTEGGAKLHEKIRHELAMMTYISEYDFISFSLVGSDVILTGWTVRQTNRDEAYNRIKNIEGIGSIVNNIDILPLGRSDMQIRAGVRANLQRMLSRYFWGSGSDIKIIVKNGDVILLGNVASKADSDIANIQANQVRGAFHIFNLLQVVEPEKKEKKG